METLTALFDPLSRYPLMISVLVGLACPLVGRYLVLRRLVFMGVALPQVSSCGIAFAFSLHAWGKIPHLEQGESALAFAGSTVMTLGAILLLSILERRARGFVEGRVGTLYVLAGAWSILLLVKNPYGEHGLLDRLKGEIIAVSGGDLAVTGVTYALVLLFLWLFGKEFLLVSFDRDMAVTLKKNILFWDLLLFGLIGITISMSVLSVGPLVTFGFLLIPSLTAHLIAGSMRQFALLSSLIGGVSGFAGYAIAYKLDLPVGPTDVVLLGIVYGAVFVIQKVLAIFAPRTARSAL
jgi:ABC-type Mn2+/Zn2+ transport system permease subunit